MTTKGGALWEWNGRREQAAALVAEDRLLDSEIAAQLGIHRDTLERWKRTAEFAERVGTLVTTLREQARQEGTAQVEERVRRLNRDLDKLEEIVKRRAARARRKAIETRTSVVEKERRNRLRFQEAGEPEEPDSEEAPEPETGTGSKATTGDTGKNGKPLPESGIESRPLEDFEEYPGMTSGLIVKVVRFSREGQTVEFKVDTPLLAEKRALMELVAKELGQRVERRELSGPGGRPIEIKRDRVDLTLLSMEELTQLEALRMKIDAAADLAGDTGA